MGPAFEAVDNTVVEINGGPRIDCRATQKCEREKTVLNAHYLKGYKPFLFAENASPNAKISAYNLVTHWSWVDKSSKIVSSKKVASVFIENGKYKAGILSLFDKNKDGYINRSELVLDSNDKISFISSERKKLGVVEPKINGSIEAVKIHHGIKNGKEVEHDCNACHGEASRFVADVELSSLSPLSVIPQLDKDNHILLNGKIVKSSNGGLKFSPSVNIAGKYVFGSSAFPWLDIIGMLLVLLTLGGVTVHGGLRFLMRKKQIHDSSIKMEKVYLYTLYERLWHWLMAMSIILLIVTGLKIHLPAVFNFMGFKNAVFVHNFIAAVLVINAIFGAFYHFSTGNIKQFLPPGQTLIQDTIAQIKYYIFGIFMGAPHPILKTKKRKMNPLQQFTYLGLLNVLFPLQMLTGMAIWASSQWPELANTFGGLAWLGPLHNLGSWLFISFIIVHVYLTSTGHTVFSNVAAMFDGYEEIELEGDNNE